MNIIADCTWSRPGESPWTGNTVAALGVMGLPEANAADIAGQIAAKKNYATGIITPKGMATPVGHFHPTHMAFGHATVCFAPRVAPGVNEFAAVYRSGPYIVAVPAVCGNPTRIEKTKFHLVPEASTIGLMLIGLCAIAAVQQWRKA